MTEHAKPTPHEIDEMVRKIYPGFRIYEVAQIERMRDQCARFVPTHTDARVHKYQRAIKAIRNVMEDLRSERLYHHSDKIRDILRSVE